MKNEFKKLNQIKLAAGLLVLALGLIAHSAPAQALGSFKSYGARPSMDTRVDNQAYDRDCANLEEGTVQQDSIPERRTDDRADNTSTHRFGYMFKPVVFTSSMKSMKDVGAKVSSKCNTVSPYNR